MAILTKAPRGTQDVLPEQSAKWQHVEKTAMKVAELFGFKEIRFPTFEHTELFARGVGDSTDVVQKEMYTFETKGGESLTLRPEGTAGAARAFLEHGLFNEALPQKLCYVINCYRYEKPQAGRWREFQQFGVEMLGTASPAADAEVISLANEIFAFLGIENLQLELNSIGCPECRKNYHNALREYFESKKENLCPTCGRRMLGSRWFSQPGHRYMDLATCPEHGKFLIRVRLSDQPDGLTRVSRLTYEATSEAAEAYARRAAKADPEDQRTSRRRRRRKAAVENVKE